MDTNTETLTRDEVLARLGELLETVSTELATWPDMADMLPEPHRTKLKRKIQTHVDEVNSRADAHIKDTLQDLTPAE